MNPKFQRLCTAIQATNSAKNRRLAKRNLKHFVNRAHFDFWDDYHLNRLQEVYPELHENLQQNLRGQIGTAQFPVYMQYEGSENSALYRMKVAPIDGDVDVIKGDCKNETRNYMLKVVEWFRPQAETTRFQVSWEKEIEFEDVEVSLPLSGKSMGLALAMAVQSWFEMTIPKDRFIFTGEVDENRRIHWVNAVPKKLSCVEYWRPLATLLCPKEDTQDLKERKACHRLALFEDVRSKVYPIKQSLEDRLDVFMRTKDSVQLLRIGMPMLDELSDLDASYEGILKLQILLKLIPAYNHTGRAMEAMEAVESVVSFICQHSNQLSSLMDDADWMHLIAHCGTSFLDEFQIEKGLQLFWLSPSLTRQNVFQVHYLGSQAKLLIVNGDFAKANELYEQNIQLCAKHFTCQPETVRTYCDYGNLLRLMERYDDAEAAFVKGLNLLKENRNRFDGKNGTEQWIKWQYAKLLMDTGREDDVVEIVGTLQPFLQSLLDIAYPKSSNVREMIEKTPGLQEGSKLYNVLYLRAEAQYHTIRGEVVPPEVIRRLQTVVPAWSGKSYKEIWKCIPY